MVSTFEKLTKNQVDIINKAGAERKKIRDREMREEYIAPDEARHNVYGAIRWIWITIKQDRPRWVVLPIALMTGIAMIRLIGFFGGI